MKNRVFDSRSESQGHSIFQIYQIYDVMGATTTPITSIIINQGDVLMRNQRSNKWTFLIYLDSVLSNYIAILNSLCIPYILSPIHDKDVNEKTGELKKPHRHGVLFFDSLKSYSQVSELLTSNLNTPSHVQIVMSSKGIYHYLTHAENPEKTQYDINDIESGCGFDLEAFIVENNSDEYLAQVIDIIDTMNFVEFGSLVNYARTNDPQLLQLIVQKTYFFAKLLDSRRHMQYEKQLEELEKSKSIHKKNNKLKKNEEMER